MVGQGDFSRDACSESVNLVLNWKWLKRMVGWRKKDRAENLGAYIDPSRT